MRRPKKRSGITPTMVSGTPLTVTARPTAPRSPAQCAVHHACETTAAGGAASRSSSGVRARPISGGTPSSPK